MKNICCSLLTLTFFSTSYAAHHRQLVECEASESTQMNRFNLSGYIDTNEKGQARAQLKASSQMAGKDAIATEYNDLAANGTARTYPAKSLGVNEVTLVQLQTASNGRTFHLTIANGLTGSQSTLVVNTIPFRAECKLGFFLK